MRTIDITNETNLELWPGRRLYIPGKLLIGLPKGAMSRDPKTAFFGSSSRSTVQVTGKSEQIDLLVMAVTDMERPEAAVKL